MFSWVAETKLR